LADQYKVEDKRLLTEPLRKIIEEYQIRLSPLTKLRVKGIESVAGAQILNHIVMFRDCKWNCQTEDGNAKPAKG
jgi:hypothetical protein